MADVLHELAVEWTLAVEKERAIIEQEKAAQLELKPTARNLIAAYLLVNYKGASKQHILRMAKDTRINAQTIQAVLDGEHIDIGASGEFARILHMSLEEFLEITGMGPSGEVSTIDCAKKFTRRQTISY
jgi:hypothetical protein